MVATRSMSDKADTRNVVRDKVTKRPRKNKTVQRAQVTSAKSGASQEVDAEKLALARSSSSDKYFDLDERTLAMGIFLDTLKEERLKNDPDFKFIREFYHAAVREFNSLNDDSKAPYISEAKKRNSMEDNDVAASNKVRQALKKSNYKYESRELGRKASDFYVDAVKAECLKNEPDFRFTIECYDAGLVEYEYLNDDGKAPYIAVAMTSYLDECAKNLKLMAELESQGY